MVQTSPQALTLEEFLAYPETKPASEFIGGKIIQKPMPKARHSRLQGKLLNVINHVAEARQIAYAFPELRCTVSGRSIVPAIAVLRWEHIQFNEAHEPVDDVWMAPDWTIEILSPEQSSNRVTGNILHCLQHGCQLGWLLDPDDRSILIFRPGQQPELQYSTQLLSVLEEIDVSLTAEQVFNWLKIQEPRNQEQ